MKQYLKLLMLREGKEVLGHRYANLWLLTLVLIATFSSIAFSDGSQRYLSYRMEDPFTNWVTINKSGNTDLFNQFKEELSNPNNMEKYGYCGVQMDKFGHYNMSGADPLDYSHISLRSFETLNTRLVRTILDESNLVEGCTPDTTQLSDDSMGFILSMQAVRKLGFDEKHLPTYIFHMVDHADVADSLGMKTTDDGFYPMPFPVIAVVDRLPGNVEMITSGTFLEQREQSSTYPYSCEHHPEYLSQLRFYVSDEVDVDEFKKVLSKDFPSSVQKSCELVEDDSTRIYRPWKPGKMLVLQTGSIVLTREQCTKAAQSVAEKYTSDQVCRVHNYALTPPTAKTIGSFISIEFSSLDHIRDFEAYAMENEVQLDMEQVASKENFQKVSRMAQVLSAAMVIFSIVCIIMFLVNMLQAYFQKVKRNLGTFKAFGINARELIDVYIIILVLIVIAAISLALLVTWCIQLLLPVCGVLQDNGFNYLSLWNSTTYVAVAVVAVSTVVTVVVVMTRMLSQTPGDLIYDRN